MTIEKLLERTKVRGRLRPTPYFPDCFVILPPCLRPHSPIVVEGRVHCFGRREFSTSASYTATAAFAIRFMVWRAGSSGSFLRPIVTIISAMASSILPSSFLTIFWSIGQSSHRKPLIILDGIHALVHRKSV